MNDETCRWIGDSGSFPSTGPRRTGKDRPGQLTTTFERCDRAETAQRLSSLDRCQLTATHHASVLLSSSAVPLPGRSSSLLSP
jgi:hypothetical protein